MVQRAMKMGIRARDLICYEELANITFLDALKRIMELAMTVDDDCKINFKVLSNQNFVKTAGSYPNYCRGIIYNSPFFRYEFNLVMLLEMKVLFLIFFIS